MNETTILMSIRRLLAQGHTAENWQRKHQFLHQLMQLAQRELQIMEARQTCETLEKL